MERRRDGGGAGGGGANVARRRMPDLDFGDVFGGAPDRTSPHGGDGEPRRRRGGRRVEDGFFDDIFGGGGAASSSSSAPPPLRDRQNQDCGLLIEDSAEKNDAAGIKFMEDNTLKKLQKMPLWTSAESGKQEKHMNVSFESAVRVDFPCKVNRSGKQVAGSQFSGLDFTNSLGNKDLKVSEENSVHSSWDDDSTVEIKGQKVVRNAGALSKANEAPIFFEEKVISGKIGEKYRTSKVKEVWNNKIEDPAQAHDINAEIDDDISSGSHGVAQSSGTITIDEIPRTLKQESTTLTVDQDGLSTPQGHFATWDIDSILENIDEICDDIEEPHNKIDDYMVEVLNWEHTDLVPSDSRLKEDQRADLILREWLSGREGNIRSLLSTLQYVLWPGCGWKTIPLVDLVEITSVRKAYLKALLSLHPDKLQQKGATAYQKYIAEKVFDILQETWSQFTSISPI